MPSDIDRLIDDVLAKHAAGEFTQLPWIHADIEECTHPSFFDKELGEVVQIDDADMEYATLAANAAPVLARELQRCREACKVVSDFGAHHPECKCIFRGQCDCGYEQCKAALVPEVPDDQR